MAAANPYINKVPFQLAGNGACFRFRTADLVQLSEKYKAPAKAEGMNWESYVERLLVYRDPACFVDCVKAGLKKDDGRTPFQISYDDLPFAPEQAAEPLLDALICALTGKSYAELLEKRRQDAEQDKAENPPGGPEEMSETSSTASSGPDSSQD